MIKGSFAEIPKGDHPWQKILSKFTEFLMKVVTFCVNILVPVILTFEAATFFAASMFT